MASTWQPVLDLLDDGNCWQKDRFFSYDTDGRYSYCVLGACGQAWSSDASRAAFLTWQIDYKDRLRSLACLLYERSPASFAPNYVGDPHTDSSSGIVNFIMQWNDAHITQWAHIKDALATLIQREPDSV